MKKRWWIAIAVVSIILNIVLSLGVYRITKSIADERIKFSDPSCLFHAVVLTPKKTCYPVDRLVNQIREFKGFCIEKVVYPSDRGKKLRKYTGFLPSFLLFSRSEHLIFSIPLNNETFRDTEIVINSLVAKLGGLSQRKAKTN